MLSEGGLFPKEIISGVPRVTLTGRNTVYVEQHQGLIAYQPEEVSFRTNCGQLNIAGKDMTFRLYTASEALIEGEIHSMSMTGGAQG